jgi:hypothetical protein
MKFRKSIEINDLIRALQIDTNNNSVLDWDFLSNNEAINWITDGREDNPREFGDCQFIRRGFLIITDNNTPIYRVLKKRLEEGRWEIILCGHNHYINSIKLYSYDFGPYIDPFIVEKYIAPKFNITKIQNKGDTSNLPQNKDYYFYLKAKNKRNLLINEKTFCGSDGCSVNLEFIYYEPSIL